MAATMAVSRLGPSPSPSAVQWSLSGKRLGLGRRGVRVATVRALGNSEGGGKSGSTELSRRALITLIALSTQLGGVASARNSSGANFLSCVFFLNPSVSGFALSMRFGMQFCFSCPSCIRGTQWVLKIGHSIWACLVSSPNEVHRGCVA